MENFNTQFILKLISKNFILFIVVFVAATVISYFASFLLKEKFKSVAVVYPVNVFQNSEESSTEQLMQYLLSDVVKQKLAKDFKLYEHYGIDTTKIKGGKALFDFVYSENFKISPTLYESIEISVKDENPVLTQKLNWALINNTNNFLKESKLKIVRQYFSNSQFVLNTQNKEIDSLNSAIKKYKGENNIVDSPEDKSDENIKFKKEKNSDIKILNGKIKATLKSYEKTKIRNDTYMLDVNSNNDYLTVVSQPNLPDKRCYPVRWVIMLTSGISAIFLVLVFLLIKNRNNSVI
jgi:capsule polysaccharide export protein KpsE/RkpR